MYADSVAETEYDDFTDASSSTLYSPSWGRASWDRRMSVVSFLSVATALPAYSESSQSTIDPEEEPPVFSCDYDLDDSNDQPHSPQALSVLGNELSASLHVLESGGVPVIYSIPSRNTHYALLQPRYSRLEALDSCAFRPRHAVRYSYPLLVKKPWGTLYVKGALPPVDPRAGLPPRPATPKKPEIWGGGTIDGSFDIDTGNDSQTIQDITLRLRGKLIFLAGIEQGRQFTFFEHDVPLWNKSMEAGNSSIYGSSSTLSSQWRGSSGRKKFIGVHKFPFSIPFPVYVDLSNRTACLPSDLIPLTESAQPQQNSFLQSSKYARPSHLPTKYSTVRIGGKEHASLVPIPPSVSKNAGAPVKVHYELGVHIKHGWLKPDTTMKVPFNYVPSMLAIPREWSPGHDGLFALPPPWRSPSAWQELPSFYVDGTLGSTRRLITANYQLFVAQPLSYVRGAHIPCFLSISGDHIEHFANPAAINVHLVRTIDYLFTPATNDKSLTDSMESYGALAYYPHSSDSTLDQGANHDPNNHTSNSNKNKNKNDNDNNNNNNKNKNKNKNHDTAVSVLEEKDTDTGKNRVVRTFTRRVARASWAPLVKDPMNPDEPDSVHLIGRINLPDDLDPSSPCPIMAVKYFVEFFTPRIRGFELSDLGRIPDPLEEEQKFASQFVEVTTLEIPLGTVPDQTQS